MGDKSEGAGVGRRHGDVIDGCQCAVATGGHQLLPWTLL